MIIDQLVTICYRDSDISMVVGDRSDFARVEQGAEFHCVISYSPDYKGDLQL